MVYEIQQKLFVCGHCIGHIPDIFTSLYHTGYLYMLDVTSGPYSTLPTLEDSGPLPTRGGFKFGTQIINTVYVCMCMFVRG